MKTEIVVSLCALLISFVGLVLTSRKDTRSDAAANAVTQTKLDNLITGVNEIRIEVRTMRDSINNHSERLTRVETLAESNSHRLDILEGKRTAEEA